MNRKTSFTLTGALLIVVFATSAALAATDAKTENTSDWKAALQKVISNAPFDSAVYVRDVVGDDSFTYHSDRIFPSANLMDLFILWDLFDRAGHGGLKLDEPVTFDHNKAVYGGILHRFQSGAVLRLADLAQIMLSVSDNTAANLLIDRLGMDKINATIHSLGARTTILARKMMDGEAKKQGRDNLTSAEDVGAVLEQILKTSPRMLDMLSVQKDISRLPAFLPFQDSDELETILVHKTGELPGIGHDAGIFFYRTSHPVVVVVLTEHTPSFQAGCAFEAQIGKIVYDAFQPRQGKN